MIGWAKNGAYSPSPSTYAYSTTSDSPCSALTSARPKRHAAWPIERVAEPPPALASTTSVPAFWIRLVKAATSSSVKLTPSTCDNRGRIVTPE
ncbi:Uncharacterised protein [Vibrio cholerae]|nr:Uncharacterised protein [Vibrio cholerae]CSC38817.1 Uncharacterised protein [Vibrio cholerae]